MDISQVKTCDAYFELKDLVKDLCVYIGRKAVVENSQTHYQYLIWIPEDIPYVPETLTYWSPSGLDFLLKTSTSPVLSSSKSAHRRYVTLMRRARK